MSFLILALIHSSQSLSRNHDDLLIRPMISGDDDFEHFHYRSEWTVQGDLFPVDISASSKKYRGTLIM